ncbi:MAG: prepilin-type N-terminal cleavage/methylation domain-containing protein [Actinomycetospora chiangmaiensis]|nr:prepilin-type N-terminal cleavage/methylation domain-containing protein [Actinomycetospora chiangmaiensis]
MRRGDEAGFTLVEVLVAFAIVSLVSLMVIRVAGTMAAGHRRIAIAEVHLDEAEGLVRLRAAAGSLRAGSEQGRFADGYPWTLSVSDAGPRLGWQGLPPLWQVHLTQGGPEGSLVYATLIPGGLGGP